MEVSDDGFEPKAVARSAEPGENTGLIIDPEAQAIVAIDARLNDQQHVAVKLTHELILRN